MNNRQALAMLRSIHRPLIDALGELNTLLIKETNLPRCPDGDHADAVRPFVDILTTMTAMMDDLDDRPRLTLTDIMRGLPDDHNLKEGKEAATSFSDFIEQMLSEQKGKQN